MFTRIETKPQFTAVGLLVTAAYEDTSAVPGTFDQFFTRNSEIQNVINPSAHLGLTLHDGKGEFTYLVSSEVSSFGTLPAGMVAATVAEQEYAVFTHRGPIHKVGETYTFIYGTWLPQSEYKRAPKPFIELYDERFSHDGEDSEMDIYIPIEKK